MRQLQRSCGVPVALDVLRETDIPEIVDRVLTEVQGRYAVPRYMDAAECAEVLRGMLPARP